MIYEMIREIFNLCSNNQMRDVYVSEVETDDTDSIVRSFCTGSHCTMEKEIRTDGVIIYELDTDGLRQRISFTPD